MNERDDNGRFQKGRPSPRAHNVPGYVTRKNAAYILGTGRPRVDKYADQLGAIEHVTPDGRTITLYRQDLCELLAPQLLPATRGRKPNPQPLRPKRPGRSALDRLAASAEKRAVREAARAEREAVAAQRRAERDAREAAAQAEREAARVARKVEAEPTPEAVWTQAIEDARTEARKTDVVDCPPVMPSKRARMISIANALGRPVPMTWGDE